MEARQPGPGRPAAVLARAAQAMALPALPLPALAGPWPVLAAWQVLAQPALLVLVLVLAQPALLAAPARCPLAIPRPLVPETIYARRMRTAQIARSHQWRYRARHNVCGRRGSSISWIML